jgi:hypothetical protein
MESDRFWFGVWVRLWETHSSDAPHCHQIHTHRTRARERERERERKREREKEREREREREGELSEQQVSLGFGV